MNLLFVLPEYYPHPGGGIATYYLELLPELVRQGHTVKVIVGSGVTNGEHAIEKDGVTVEYLKPDRFRKFSLFPELQKHLAASWAMWEQTYEGKGFDVIETTDWGLGYTPWLINSGSLPVVITLHASIGQIEYHEPRVGYELHGDIVRMIECNLLESAQTLITYSESNKAEWQNLIHSSVLYIPPAFHIRSSSKAENDGLARVVGRVQHWKGPETLCQALNILGTNAVDVEWIGKDMEYKGNIKSTSGYLQQHYPQIWKVKVKTTGALPYTEVQKRMAQARFGIVPSIWDVFNYTCVEWMNCSKTVICSQGAGAADLIDHGKNGFVFPKEDYQTLAQLLSEVNSLTINQLQKIGENARDTVEKKLDPAIVAQMRLKIYEEIIKHTPVKQPNFWLKSALSPSQTIDSIEETLNHLPLKKISKYTIDRTLKKMRSNG